MPEPLLKVSALDAFYGDFQALFQVGLDLMRGEALAIVGANGAGKSTLLKTVAGQIRARKDAVIFEDEPIGGQPAHATARRGIALVPEGRRLFPSLSVEENLRIGAESRRTGPWTLARIYELFPVLGERRDQPATALSGGQQQMVALGRGLMSNPRLLLCDEISLGLAPIIVKDIYAKLPQILGEGLSLVIVEQDVVQALGAAERVICLQEGRVTLSRPTSSVTRDEIAQAYFGV